MPTSPRPSRTIQFPRRYDDFECDRLPGAHHKDTTGKPDGEQEVQDSKPDVQPIQPADEMKPAVQSTQAPEEAKSVVGGATGGEGSVDFKHERTLKVARITVEKEHFTKAIRHGCTKLRDMIAKSGSRTLMTKMVTRLDQTLNDLNKTSHLLLELCEDRNEMGDIMTKYGEMEEEVREVSDAVTEHLELRVNEPPSIPGSREGSVCSGSQRQYNFQLPPSKNPGMDVKLIHEKIDEGEHSDSTSSDGLPSEVDIEERVAEFRVSQEKLRYEEELRIKQAQERLIQQQERDIRERAAFEVELRQRRTSERSLRQKKTSTPKGPPPDDQCSQQSRRSLSTTSRKSDAPLQKILTTLHEGKEAEFHRSIKSSPVRESPLAIQNLNNFFQGMAKPHMPKFYGDREKYPDWRAQYDIFVHQRNLPIHFKMLVLKEALGGRAERTVARLGFSDNQYELAIAKLDQKYGGERRQLQRQIESIITLPNIKEDNLTELEDISDRLCDIVAKLMDNGQTQELTGASSLYTLVLQKMPENLLLRYHEMNGEDSRIEDGLAKFADWLNRQVSLRLELAEIKSATKKSSRPNQTSHKDRQKRQNPSSQAHMGKASEPSAQQKSDVKPETSNTNIGNTSKSINEASKQTCPVCQKGPHYVHKCRQWWSASIEERWQMAKELKLCYRCLDFSHYGRECPRVRKCDVDGCSKTHHRSLHNKSKPEQPTQAPLNNAFGVSPEGKVTEAKVALRSIPVYLVGKDGCKRKVNAFLDDGSDSTYIRTDIARALGLDIEESPLTISTITNRNTEISSGLVCLTVESLDGTIRRKIGARTLPKLCEDLPIVDWRRKRKKWAHLRDINFPRVPGYSTVDILIGSDHPELTLSCEEKVGKQGDPVARLTPLGWTCVGSLSESKAQSDVHYTRCNYTLAESEIDEQLKALWDMDVLETCMEQPLNPEEKIALSKVEASRLMVDGHYEVCIPWRDEVPQLSNNRAMAEKRFINLERSMVKTPKIAERYAAVIQSNIEKGYIEEVKDPVVNTPCWYLPHFPVIREDKSTTKVRIVLDSAAKYHGKSLNDVMLPGPKLQQDLVSILIRFRRGRVALIGDIKEMFSQVRMKRSDQDYHRLLWREFGSQQPFKVYRAVRLTFGDCASPFLAQYVIRQHALENQETFPLAASTCLNSTYMDDAIDSIDSVEEGLQLRMQLTQLLKGGGFEIRKWCSNELAVLDGVADEDKAEGIVRVSESELPSLKTLGVLWNAASDTFGFAGGVHAPESYSKRTLLSRVATLFDPLQFLAPFTIRAKILLQKAWMTGIGWDDELPEAIITEAQEWFEELSDVISFSIPRYYFGSGRVLEIQLHTFTDASSEAYAAVSYLRSVTENGISLRLVAAKARVAPLKAVSIPRLELLGAVLGYRLTMKLTKLLSVSDFTLWSDSMDVIHWIRGRSRTYKTFVANRVAEIHGGTVPSQWRHVPGCMNPADVATRGMSIKELTHENVWCIGPEYLLGSPETWPVTKTGSYVASEEVHMESKVMATSIKPSTADIRWNEFTSWISLKRVVAWRTEFVKILMKRSAKRRFLTASDLAAAETTIIRDVQRESFPEIVKELSSGKITHQGTLRNLSPFLDEDGVLRVGGRLQNSNLPYDSKHPILLPQNHHVSKLIILEVHSRGFHVRGVNGLLSDLRAKYWIVRGRELIKKIQQSCLKCKRLRGKPFDQLMAPLPSHRSTISIRPFARSGVDFGGPFITKLTRRVTAKRYLCLFTCLTTRAVHLEMAYSLDTSGFLLAFSRMVARRGKPEEMVSDNGTNFVGANRELSELVKSMNFDEIEGDAANQGIHWRFNPPLGAHHGGVFESMIKSAKKIMSSILGSAGITDEELLTAIVEAEGLLNSRPLMYCGDDIMDEPVLTPNHFLHGQCGGSLAPRVVDETDFNPRHRWRLVQDLLSQFWRRWQKEYLASLQVRSKWHKEKQGPECGDVVLLVEQNNPRGKWPIALVEEVFPGKDGLIRTVKVQSRGKSFLRPITRLCPFLEDEKKEEK